MLTEAVLEVLHPRIGAFQSERCGGRNEIVVVGVTDIECARWWRRCGEFKSLERRGVFSFRLGLWNLDCTLVSAIARIEVEFIGANAGKSAAPISKPMKIRRIFMPLPLDCR